MLRNNLQRYSLYTNLICKDYKILSLTSIVQSIRERDLRRIIGNLLCTQDADDLVEEIDKFPVVDGKLDYNSRREVALPFGYRVKPSWCLKIFIYLMDE